VGGLELLGNGKFINAISVLDGTQLLAGLTVSSGTLSDGSLSVTIGPLVGIDLAVAGVSEFLLGDTVTFASLSVLKAVYRGSAFSSASWGGYRWGVFGQVLSNSGQHCLLRLRPLYTLASLSTPVELFFSSISFPRISQ
jgi:hypothetical protein